MKRNIAKVALMALAVAASLQAQAQKIVFVDMEYIQQNYGLQVEVEDSIDGMQKRAEQQMQAKQKSIETTMAGLQKNMEAKAAAIQKKQNIPNGYKTEAEYKKDMTAFENMQKNAIAQQQKLEQEYAQLQQKLAADLQNAQVRMTKRVMDSIEKGIAEFNQEKKYDYILIKSATLYANPEMEVTKELLEVLNKQYTDSKNPTPAN